MQHDHDGLAGLPEGLGMEGVAFKLHARQRGVALDGGRQRRERLGASERGSTGEEDEDQQMQAMTQGHERAAGQRVAWLGAGWSRATALSRDNIG